MEKLSRGDLPRFQDGYAVARVTNVSRLEGKLPPLMDDLRATYLVESRPPGSNLKIYLKAVGSPYTGEHGVHFLTIPDRDDHENIPGIQDLSVPDLQQTLQFAEGFARHTAEQSGIDEIDFGWHHSRAELTGIPKQRVATFPQNLHIHITGYNREDMQNIPMDEIKQSDELTGKTGEALHKFGEQLFFEDIVPQLRIEFPTFDDLFEEITDDRGRKRFKLRQGKETFKREDFAAILKAIDAKGKVAYDAIARCFFEYNESSQSFVEKDDEYRRFKLLASGERQRRIKEYISQKPWLTEGIKMGLQWLAFLAKDEVDILERELDKAKVAKGTDLTPDEQKKVIADTANRFWAYKDFSYAMVFSSKKTDQLEPEWVFGFEPKIFTVEGIVQSSSFIHKLPIRDGNKAYSEDQLSAVQARERKIINETLRENPDYQLGPGIELNA